MNKNRLNIARQAAERSEISSFMVMDVMAAAARREAEGLPVVHLEVGNLGQVPQPPHARPPNVPLMPIAWATPCRLASQPCASGSRRITSQPTALICARTRRRNQRLIGRLCTDIPNAV